MPDVHDAMVLVRDTVRAQTRIIENNQPGAQGLTDIWDEFLPDYLRQVENFAEDYVTGALTDIETIWNRDGTNNPLLRDVLETIRSLRRQIPDMKLPPL
jgi:hypothetical protein